MKRSPLWMALCAGVALAPLVRAADWPQWRGPDRSGLSKETGLLKSWPEGGPKLLWKASDRGLGHATPSVARGRVFGMGLRGNDEMVWALDEKTGQEVWSVKIADGITLDARQGGYGSRSTPTVDGNRLYTIGVGGLLVCLNVSDGQLVWKQDLVRDFGGRIPAWGYSESPLVYGDTVIATPGGANTVVAFQKRNGQVAWKAAVPKGNGVAYSSAISAKVGNSNQVIQFLSGTLVGLDAKTGQVLWNFDAPATPRGINCSTPIYADGFVFAAAGYQHGGALGKLTALPGGGFAAEQVYFTREMQNHHGGMVLLGDHLYGFTDAGQTLTCMEFKTGKVRWADRSVGKGSVTFADGHVILRSERGPVALVEANPEKYVEKGRFEQPERSGDPSWPYPVVANGKLFLRDQGILLCYDIKGGTN